MTHKPTYKELEKKAAFFQTLADNSYDWEIFVDLAGEIKYISPSCELISGYAANEFIENPKLLTQIVHQADKEIVDNHFDKKLKHTAENISLAYRIITKNGDIKWIEHNCKKSFDRSNRIIGYSSSNRDITERQNKQDKLIQTEKELTIAKEKAEASEDKFRAIIETSPDGISITSLDGKLQYVSPRILAMWGYEHESEMIGRNMSDFFRSDYHEKAAQSIGGMFSGNFVGAEEYVMIRKDGSEFFGEANTSLLYDEKNEPVSILIIERDITNRKNAELEILKQKEQLQELNATKDKLFSIIAHDLRSPFNSILGFLELLIENVNEFETAETEKYLGIINSSANNTLILLDNLLNWAKSQTGQISFKPEILIFSSVILEIIKLKKSIAKAKNISLNYFSSDEIEVYADINMLKTVLRNLISNAIKFTKSGGNIRVFAVSKHDRVEISISDNGVGMNEETRNKLFRLETNETTKGTANEKGSGLGLILCKEFVEKHGGKIWLESELGKGSVFKFNLPVSKSKSTIFTP